MFAQLWGDVLVQSVILVQRFVLWTGRGFESPPLHKHKCCRPFTFGQWRRGWGDQWDNVDMNIVRAAIKGIKEMDHEHGAFWVGLMREEENVLEVHKDLELFGVFEEEPGIQYKAYDKRLLTK
jgi:hypothetical protein